MNECEILDFVTMSVRGVGTFYGAYRWWAVCMDEASWFRGNAIGNTNLGKLIGGTSITDIDGAAGYSPLYDTFYFASILGNVWDGFNAYNNHGWDSFDFSLNATQGLTRLVMWLDKLAKLNVVQPQHPWTRYLNVA
jgi:hypothetical protein